jgi:acetolactate synthase-1/2/3 large subunit
MNGAECLLRTLLANGIDLCLMNPGTSEMQFVAALDRVPGMRGVLCLFEGVCSGAADGYARMTRRPAATLLHLGPGLANGLSNFHNARKARSPIVSIVGEHSTQHLRYDAPLTADIEAFARTVSDDVRLVRSAAETGCAAAETIAAAQRPPGGVAMLIVPADFSWSEAGEPGGVIRDAGARTYRDERVRDVARIVRERRNIGLLLGGRAATGDALRAAGRLASAAGVRVFVDRNASRLESGRGRFQPQRIPYFPEPAEALLAGLEHLILVEAKPPVSFFGYPGQRSYLAPDNCEIHHLTAIDEDGPGALEALIAECGAGRAQIHTADAGVAELPPAGPLTVESIGRILAALLPENAVISDEMVSSGPEVGKWLVKAAAHDFLPVTGGSIGQGLPVAVGAALACPERKVIALEADGSAMYTHQSLWTMARENLDVVTVIFANRRYRILDVEMRRTGAEGFGRIANDMIDIGRPDLDWVKLSEGMGVEAARAETSQAFAEEFAAAVRAKGPRLIEAVLPPE